MFFCVLVCGPQQIKADVLDFLTLRDLELVDSVNKTHSGVAGVLDRTQTKAGSQNLREMLVDPLTDVSAITKRQQAIKALVDDPQLLETIKNLLACIALHEDSLTFFDPKKTSPALTAVVESFKYSTSFLKGLNNSS